MEGKVLKEYSHQKYATEILGIMKEAWVIPQMFIQTCDYINTVKYHILNNNTLFVIGGNSTWKGI